MVDLFQYNNLFELGQKIQESFLAGAWSILGLYFVWCIASEVMFKVKGEGDLIKLVVRLLLCVVLLTNILSIRNFFYDTGISLAESIYSEKELKKLELPIEDIKGKETGVWDTFKHGFMEKTARYFLYLLKGLYWVVTIILMFVRNLGHFICYITAPLAIVFLLSEKTQYVAIGFFKRFLALCLWPVYISTIYLVVSSVTTPNFKLSMGSTNLLESVAYLLILSLLLTVVPLFASQFVNGMWGVAEASVMNKVFNMVPAAAMTHSMSKGAKYATNPARYLGGIGKETGMKLLKKGEEIFPSRVTQSKAYNVVKAGAKHSMGAIKNERFLKVQKTEKKVNNYGGLKL